MRFSERVAEFRRSFLLFAFTASALGVAIFFGLAFLLHGGLMAIGTYGPMRAAGLGEWISERPWLFWLVYCLIFLGFGWFQHRAHIAQVQAMDDLTEILRRPGVWPVALLGGGELIGVLFFLLTFPAFVFHMGREIFTSEGTSASEAAAGLALEILLESGDRISPEILEAELSRRPVLLRNAMALLLQLKLILVRRKGQEMSLLKTIEWQEFLEASS